MPLLLAVIGKKRPTKKSNPTYSYGDTSSRSRSRKFDRFRSLDGAAPLPEAEGLELATAPHDRLDDHDDMRLVVEGTKRPGEIVVTNQIVQLSQTTSHEEDASDQKAEDVRWDGRQPSQAHLRTNI